MDQNSVEFIKKLFDSGKSREEIKQSFLDYGWNEEVIEKMIAQAQDQRQSFSLDNEKQVFQNQKEAKFDFKILFIFIFIAVVIGIVYASKDRVFFYLNNQQVEEISPEPYINEEKLADLPKDAQITECALSFDLKHKACVFKTDQYWKLIYDNVFSDEYQDILYKSLIFSPDSKKFAYVAKISLKWSAVLNGYSGPLYDEILYPVFSPDGASFIYTLRNNNKWFLSQDNILSQEYSNPVYAAFSKNGKESGYIFHEDGKEYFLLNNQKSKAWDTILKSSLVFSKDGQSFIYAGKQGNDWYVIYNSQEFGPYQAVLETAISDDGNNFAYNANILGEWFLFKNNEKIGPFGYVYGFDFSKSDNSLAYCGIQGNDYFVAYGNKLIKDYQGVFSPRFSLDGKYISFIGIKNLEEKKELYFITREFVPN